MAQGDLTLPYQTRKFSRHLLIYGHRMTSRLHLLLCNKRREGTFATPNIAFTKAMNKWNKGGETPLWRCSFYRPFQCFLLLSSFQRRCAYYSTFTAGAGAELHRKCGGFAPLVDEHTEQMDAPPYGRAVSDAPPHSGLSPIAVFRHYCSRLT